MFALFINFWLSEKSYSVMSDSVWTPLWHMRKPGIQFGKNVPGVSQTFDTPFVWERLNTFTKLLTHKFEMDVLQYFCGMF